MKKIDNYNVYVEIGSRIRFLRKSKNMTIENLSLIAGINRNYLGDLERGKRNPTLSILAKIAKALDISLEELFSGIGNHLDI